MRHPCNEPIRTSPFGPRGASEFHSGTDWVDGSGEGYLYGITEGVVVAKDYQDKRAGHYLTIRYNYIDGRTFDGYYAHLAQPALVDVGDRVGEHQIIGDMGDTGNTTGRHLHFGVFLNGRWVDPELFLDTFRQAEDDESVYITFHEVFSGHTPSERDVRNFRTSGFPWLKEFERVKDGLRN